MNDFDVTPICGGFRVEKEGGHQSRRRRRHTTFSAAETAAAELVHANPGEKFVITQEVARVERRLGTARP